ncbi:NAD-dependent epimerase/dehydratase family protein [Oxalicibacterium solurbis]|uniref:UDP-glucose 4-epimerase n=1 Tax=Oxalicibacterium solurbis TaxID=69280 RepID=A0A8J3F6C1_9BURK|nr:NAD(P)-dependent oxidoreductase [Oxalicibacterium solurbis]GGI54436.1 UDP-glucose 4-epimerase [Oxalicibacterium solurbis]
MKKTVLITGAHGFLGRHAARYFADAGYTVTGIGHGSWDSKEFARFGLTFWHAADITLDALVTYAGEPDMIVHCAGSGSVAFSMTHPYQDYGRTVSSMAAVLEYVRLHSPKTSVIYPSSAAVYGVVEKLPIMEASPLHPVSPYGVHKQIAEMLCQSYASSFHVSVAIIRFFSIYGPGLQKQLLWDACSKAERGDTAFSGTGLELRDWLHVIDAASLLGAVASHASPECPVFNGGSGEGVTVKEVLDEIVQAYGLNSGPKFSGKSRPGDPIGYQADMDNTIRLGWKPTIDWRSGVSDYVKWFKGACL